MNYREIVKRLAVDELFKLMDSILSKFKSLGIDPTYHAEIVEMFSRIKYEKEKEIDDTNKEGLF